MCATYRSFFEHKLRFARPLSAQGLLDIRDQVVGVLYP